MRSVWIPVLRSTIVWYAFDSSSKRITWAAQSLGGYIVLPVLLFKRSDSLNQMESLANFRQLDRNKSHAIQFVRVQLVSSWRLWIIFNGYNNGAPPVISRFINHSTIVISYIYIYIPYQPYLLELTPKLANYGAPPCKNGYIMVNGYVMVIMMMISP